MNNPTRKNKDLPNHIAFIMDGNGRWAKKRGLDRVYGHEQGFRTFVVILKHLKELGIPFATFYAFSTENWNRPKKEVSYLLSLLNRYLNEDVEALVKNGIRVRSIGNIEALPSHIQKSLAHVIDATKACFELNLTIALSYGSHEEITWACKQIARKVSSGALPVSKIDADVVTQHLYTSFLPSPDLFIRTSGELRLSNFLLWQISYAELFFTPVMWPDFSIRDLEQALLSYKNRQRRYGYTPEQIKACGAPKTKS